MTMNHRLLAAALVLIGSVPLCASGPSFHLDVTLNGADLNGWHTFGQADWHAEKDGVVGTPKQADGGWLVLDHSYQDVNFYTEYRCADGCVTGVLLRAEKTSEGGLKGIYVSLSDPDLGEYAVTIDAQGKIVSRDKLRRGGGLIRVALPPQPGQGAGFTMPRGARPSVELPVVPENSDLRPNDWNFVEIFLDANIVRALLNNGREIGAVGDVSGYGPVALYVGGSGSVQFRGVAVGDMGLKVREPEKVSDEFRKQRLSDFYYSWEAAAADFNHDGVLDVVSGPYIYYGPDYLKSREIWLAHSSSETNEFAGESNMEYAADFTGDGWPDVITVDYGGANAGVDLYVNPKGEGRRWDKYKVVTGVQSEIAVLRDLDGDGVPTVCQARSGKSHRSLDSSQCFRERLCRCPWYRSWRY